MNTNKEFLIRLPRAGILKQEVASFLVWGVVSYDLATSLRVRNDEAAEEQLENSVEEGVGSMTSESPFCLNSQGSLQAH